ncbi:MAG: hypothetical protein HPY79_11830 [Bacteroidales bacterium]|nr:hypothetical protein [Bacteroidales bacterium]
MGFSTGYAFGKEKSAPSIGIVHGIVNTKYMFYDGSAVKIAFYNEGSQTSKIIALELMILDIGFGYGTKNFFIGLSPFSINLTQSPCFGMAVLSRFRMFEKVTTEVKFMPKLYGKPEDYGVFNNNFHAGVHYWFSEKFSLGLRYSRYNYHRSFSVMASWNFLEI